MLSTNLQHLFTYLQTHTPKSGLFCGSNYYSKIADCQQHAWICGDVVTILENGSRVSKYTPRSLTVPRIAGSNILKTVLAF
ncbi:hypothetical protein VDGL01_06171 [Verticillium dahliae]